MGVCMHMVAICMGVPIHMANTASKLNRKPTSKMLLERHRDWVGMEEMAEL